MADCTKLGNATVTRVLEWQFDVGTELFAETPPQAWRDEADLLVPTFYDPTTARWRVVMQSWVIDVDGLTVVVDTGVGNDRERPHMPMLSGLATDFLGALSRAGVAAEDVDVVVNTHLHTDHVGWNTRLAPEGWMPTFPNARYLVPEADYRHFSPDGPGASDGARMVMADSVFPIADQMQLWSDDFEISESLRLRPAAGHTPG
nr:MBL fold metallo-hydrolase [Actinomycetota bacterium]